MTKLRLFQIDAFTDNLFQGNPAAVCPLEKWLPDTLLQAIAAENNLSETAFYVPARQGFQLRWFTPVAEVDLCGHATLAAAYVLFHLEGHPQNVIVFESKSGRLKVRRDNDLLVLDFPAQPPAPISPPKALLRGLDKLPLAVLAAEDYMALYADPNDVGSLAPDFALLGKLDLRGVIATAPGEDVDFVSRFFAPKLGIDEDPVTGSAHCELAPYWAVRLKKTKLTARQLSSRGGRLFCELKNNRVLIAGRAVEYLQGTINCPEILP